MPKRVSVSFRLFCPVTFSMKSVLGLTATGVGSAAAVTAAVGASVNPAVATGVLLVGLARVENVC